MTQTIRDVLIKIGIESNTRGFKAPDWRQQQQQVEKYKRAVDDLSGSLRNMPRPGGFGGAPGGVGPGARTRGAHSPQPRVDQYFGDVDIGVNRYGNQFGRQNRFNEQIVGGDELMLRRSDTLAKAEQQNAKAADILEKRHRALMEVENQRAEALNGLAMGTMKVVRGMAFLGAANETEYQQMLKLIAQAQGYFDLFTGILDIYKNVVNWKKAAAAATAVETTAETALAAARGRSAVAGAAGTAASGIGGAAGAAGMGRLATMFGGGAAGIAMRVGGPLAISYGLGKVGAWTIREGFGVHGMDREDARLAARTTAFNERRGDLLSDSQYDVNRYLSMFGDRYESRSATRRLAIDRGRLSAADAISQIRAQGEQDEAVLRYGRQRGHGIYAGVESAQTAQTIAEARSKREQEILTILEAEESSLRKQWDTAQGLLRTTQETLQAEKDRYASMEERFGRLDAGQQGRLRAIAEKRGRGEALTRADIQALDAAGAGGSAAVSQFYRENARRGGFDQFAGAFGEDAGLRQAQQTARHAADLFRQTNEDVVDALKAVSAQRQESNDKLIALLADLKEKDAQLADAIERLSRIGRENQAGQVKASGAALGGWGFGLFGPGS